MMVGIQKIFT